MTLQIIILVFSMLQLNISGDKRMLFFFYNQISFSFSCTCFMGLFKKTEYNLIVNFSQTFFSHQNSAFHSSNSFWSVFILSTGFLFLTLLNENKETYENLLPTSVGKQSFCYTVSFCWSLGRCNSKQNNLQNASSKSSLAICILTGDLPNCCNYILKL